MNRNQLADHIQGLTPQEFGQLQDLSDYLGEKASPGNPNGYLAEGSVPALLNSQSPRVRQAVKGMQEVISTPREMPFAPKRSEAENLDQLGFDRHTGQVIQDVLDTSDVAAGLMSRLGTDADTPDSELTTRDVLSAAFDHHEGSTND